MLTMKQAKGSEIDLTKPYLEIWRSAWLIGQDVGEGECVTDGSQLHSEPHARVVCSVLLPVETVLDENPTGTL